MSPNFGETPSLLYFGNDYIGRHDRILIGEIAQGIDVDPDGAGGPRDETTGIDAFRDTILHENHHVQQSILWTNQAFGRRIPITGTRPVADSAWSFNLAFGAPSTPGGRSYNHFLDLNNDGDTSDMVLESAIVRAPGGPRDVNGNGVTTDLINEDMDLDRNDAPDWDNTDIEVAAFAAEPDAQDGLAAVDWANPGKNHGTNFYDD